jgi:RNA polymerase sigma factor (sigma-70 family)
MSEVTHLIDLVADGDEPAKARLFEIVYQELRKGATRKLERELHAHSLTPTALVSEVYIKFFEKRADPNLQNRRYFYGAAANAMRQILVDHARSRNALKRGGAGRTPTLDKSDEHVSCGGDDLASAGSGDVKPTPMIDPDMLINPAVDLDRMLDIDEALTRFEAKSPALAELAKLRYFAGMTIREAAEAMGISISTASKHWAYARAWLSCELKVYSASQP